MNPLATIGKIFLRFLAATGALSQFTGHALNGATSCIVFCLAAFLATLSLGFFSHFGLDNGRNVTEDHSTEYGQYPETVFFQSLQHT